MYLKKILRVGVFAGEVVDRFPLLPVEEEGRLNKLYLRENFIERIFIYYRWRKLVKENPTADGLMTFHSAIKLSLLSHSPRHYRRLGTLVARAAESMPWKDVVVDYGRVLVDGLKVPTTPGKHCIVLMSLVRLLRGTISPGDKAELLDAIDSYRKRVVPLGVPILLLKRHQHDLPGWVHKQFYLNPYPQEMILRFHDSCPG